jgi:hypothetical protein
MSSELGRRIAGMPGALLYGIGSCISLPGVNPSTWTMSCHSVSLPRRVGAILDVDAQVQGAALVNGRGRRS